MVALFGEPKTYRNYDALLRTLGERVRFLRVPELPEDCTHLLLPGGGDVAPERYGQENRGSTDVDEARDEAELHLIRQALERKRPILGICRGIQILNVAFGGTLLQDVPGHGGDLLHGVRALTPEWNVRRFPVRSAHHQAIGKLGDGLILTAVSDDGIAEAMRHRSLPIFGVQWHPERFGTAGNPEDRQANLLTVRAWLGI